MQKPEVEALILSVVERLNPELPENQRIPPEPDTELLGKGAQIDSLTFVTLILSIEDALGDATGTRLSLVDDKAMSHSNSPFRTLASLSDYVTTRLQAAA